MLISSFSGRLYSERVKKMPRNANKKQLNKLNNEYTE